MSRLGMILTVSLTLYALGMCIFLISENRRPQATLAWMLALLFVPGIGLLIYLLFGRDRKAFSKQRRLLRQDLEANALPLLSPLLSRQDAEIARLEGESASHRRLMRLVRRNSYTKRAICTPRRSASTPRSARSARPTSTSAASASTTNSTRCCTANRSPRSWRRTSSGTWRTAPSSTWRPTGSAAPPFGSGTRPPGSSPPCCERRIA